jgi:hypothetical protein
MGNRYKNSLFRSLFSDEDEWRDLYNALKDTQYDKNTAITHQHAFGNAFYGRQERHIIYHHSTDTPVANCTRHNIINLSKRINYVVAFCWGAQCRDRGHLARIGGLEARDPRVPCPKSS